MTPGGLMSHLSFHLSIRVCIFVCVCIYTYTHIHIYQFIFAHTDTSAFIHAHRQANLTRTYLKCDTHVCYKYIYIQSYIYIHIITYLSQVKHENKDASIYILEVATVVSSQTLGLQACSTDVQGLLCPAQKTP